MAALITPLTLNPFTMSMSNKHGPGQVIVVMVPFPAQGHLNQLLHLSRLISAYDIPVHYVSTTIHNRQAKLRVHGWDPLSISNIHFHDFQTPSFPSPPPNPNSPLGHLLPSFELASSHLRKPVASLLQQLSSAAKRRLVIIHDSLMSSVVQDLVLVPNAEAYTFHSVSAFTVFLHLWENLGRPFAVQSDILKDLPSLDGCFTSDFANFISSQHDCMKFNSGKIYNTCKLIETPYLDLLAKEQISKNKKQWPLGPFNPVSVSQNKTPNPRHQCLKWLDKQATSSVIFVSFGTTSSLSDQQIQELALGLEKGVQNFIWVLRDADKGDVFGGEVRRAILPKGYEERMKGKGMIVRDWAPQLEILAHPSTAGFMSHCGWNSCMESITMGVPILAWPMHSDQPRNTVLITKLLRIGLVVKNWSLRDELVVAETVGDVIKKLMTSEEGGEIRRRAAKLGGDVRMSVAGGGVSRLELDSFIIHISR
uniref:Glycosyltransferase n=1 Tax=Panax ginseng TaxID=4054 RepID=A0A0D5ZDD5_PANGI|nr:UGTPg36 [Panax ginseng]